MWLFFFFFSFFRSSAVSWIRKERRYPTSSSSSSPPNGEESTLDGRPSVAVPPSMMKFHGRPNKYFVIFFVHFRIHLFRNGLLSEKRQSPSWSEGLLFFLR